MFIDISSKEGEEDKLKARLTMLMPHASLICSLHKQVRRDKGLAQDWHNQQQGKISNLESVS
jgi:hypothetical protein